VGAAISPDQHNVTTRDLWEDYRRHDKMAEDRHEIWTFYVARPLSFPVTALCLRLGVSANQATALSVPVFAAGALLLAFGSWGAAVAGALLINAWLVIDCVDGNIARYRRTASSFGGFADAISGYVVLGTVCFSAGIGAFVWPSNTLAGQWLGWGSEDLAFALIAGAWASLASLWIRLVYQKWTNTFPTAGEGRHDLMPSEGSGAPSLLARTARFGNNLLNISGLLLPLLLVAVLLRALDLFVVVSALGNTGILVLALRKILRASAPR
jgi:phosphatidylglycerophosphate synthase